MLENQQHTQTLRSDLTGGQGGKVGMTHKVILNTNQRNWFQHPNYWELWKNSNNINVKQFSPQTTATRWDSPSSLNFALASSKMFRTFWIAHAYNFPKVTSSSILLNGGIRSTSFKQSVRGSLQRKTTTTKISIVFLLKNCGCKSNKKFYPILAPSGISLCHPQNIAYCTDGSKKFLADNFRIVSIPSRRTSALSNCQRKKKLSHLCKLLIIVIIM